MKMKVKDFKIDGDCVFVITENQRLLFTELTEDEITWFDITPDENKIEVIRQKKGEDPEEGDGESSNEEERPETLGLLEESGNTEESSKKESLE